MKHRRIHWRRAEVADLQRDGILLVEDGNHGEYRPRPDEFVDHGVAFIRAADMDDGRVLFESASKINGAARNRIRKGIGAPGDILLSHKGTVGKVAVVPDDAPNFVCSPQTTFWRVLDPDELDRRYLHAFLRSPSFQGQLSTRAGETDMAPYVSLTSQRKLLVLLPSIGEQRAIGDLIGSLDDKIDLNRQMNRTLEETAQTLFRAWFVDFEGENDLVESELGPIPRAWEVISLGGIAENLRTSRHPQELDPVTPYLGLADLTPGTVSSYSWGQASVATSAKVAFAGGDLLFGKLRPYFKKVIVAPFDGVCSSDILVIRPKDERWFGVVVGLLTNDRFIDFCDGASSGTRMPRVNWRTMSKYRLAVPRNDSDLLKDLASLFRIVVARINHGMLESRTLAELRDTLLPKLISGEIRVPEAEEAFEEAV